jgi:hypothetical protein
MDKLRVILEYVRKYHFWLLCVVAIVASLVGWMMARGTLSDEYNKGKSAIVGKFDALKQVEQIEFPPNSTWKEGLDKLTVAERQKVKTAWQTVYDEQQKVLEWPASMGPKFKDVVTKWIAKPDVEFDGNVRTAYRDGVVKQEFPKLPAIVDAKMENEDDKNPQPAGRADATARTDAAAAAAPSRQYKVVWDAESQKKVKNSLEMSDEGEPTSFEVALKLEDLWVYKALLNLIRLTNENSQYTSRVKHINGLLIGVEAAKRFQDGMKPGKIARAQPPGGENADPGAQQAQQQPSEESKVKPAPDEGRYVSIDGAPLGTGVAQKEQFKRMPIYLELKMDQREIPRLLTECANSPLPVEVRQLRINPKADESGAGPKAPAGGPGGGNAGPSPTDADVFDVTVEIHGIIYIFNPPDASKLGEPGAAAPPAAA